MSTNTSDWIKTHWPVIVALCMGGVAWGQQQAEVKELRGTVVELKAQDAKITIIKEQNIRHEVLLQQMQQQLANQDKYLRALVEANPKAKERL